MKSLDAVIDWYTAAIDANRMVEDLLSKSPKLRSFHQTIFFKLTLDQARNLLETSRAELSDLVIVSLVSIFEKTLTQKGDSGIESVLPRFEHLVKPKIYSDVRMLCAYRHWVAHGKKWDKPAHADPVYACQQLQDFLKQANIK